VQALVARLIAATGRSVVVDGVEHRVGVSVGAVTSSADSTAEGMLSRADAEMYAAKRARRERRAQHAAATPAGS
jgi:GGDEF domain-containing protein